MRSRPSRRRLISHHWRRYSGRPSGCQTSGPGAGEPALVAIGHAVVRVQRLADELLADVRAVGVGGVDEVDAELGRRAAARGRASSRSARRRPRCPGR